KTADLSAWRKRSEVFERALGDELVLITDRGTGDLVYVIRHSAGRLIWKLLADARTPAAMASELARARQRAATESDIKEVDHFIRDLAQADLIVDVSSSTATVDRPTSEALPVVDDLPPTLEAVELGKLLPDDLVLQGITVGFHAAGHAMTGAV